MEMVFMILGLLVLAMIAFWLVQFIECKKDGKDGEQEKRYLKISLVTGLIILLGFSGAHFYNAQRNSSEVAPEETASRVTESLASTQETPQATGELLQLQMGLLLSNMRLNMPKHILFRQGGTRTARAFILLSIMR